MSLGSPTPQAVSYTHLDVYKRQYVPRHRNSYDVLFVNLKFPLPGSGPNLAEPIGGTLTYRPECLWSEGGTTYAATPPVSGHIEVNIYLQSEGSSGEPMVTLRQVASAVASLDREQPGCLQHACLLYTSRCV